MVFLIGLFAIAGTPPFSIFSSEMNMLMAVFEKKDFILGGAVILLLSLVFAGIAVTLFRMFYGREEQADLKPGEVNKPGTFVVVLLLGLIAISGVYMPTELKSLITDAQRIVTGG
jgi:hydrogenase-4 component F